MKYAGHGKRAKEIDIVAAGGIIAVGLALAAAVLFAPSNTPGAAVGVAYASASTGFTFATTTSPYVPASVNLAAGRWLIEAVPKVGVATGNGTTGCLVTIKTNVPNTTDYNGTFRISTDYAWHLQGGEAAHAVINLSQDTNVQASLSYTCNYDGSAYPGTNSVTYLFFPISATSGFQYVTSGGVGPLSVKSPTTLPSAKITLPAGTWVMEDIPGVKGGGGGSNGGSGGCQFKPNVYGTALTSQQTGSFRVYTNETPGAIEDPGYAVFTTTAPATTLTVNTSYESCSSSGGDSATSETTNFVMYKFFQVQPGRFQYVQGYNSVPLTAGGWTVETSLDVLGIGGNYEGCGFNTYLRGANPPVGGSCSNPSSTCQESERVCTSYGTCSFGSCTTRASCQRPIYLGGCGGTWVQGCSGTWDPTPSNAWSQSGGFFVYDGSTQAAGQRSSFLGVNLSSPATVSPYYSTFNCSTNPQYGGYYNVNGLMNLFFSNSPSPLGSKGGTLTVTSENSVVTSTLVNSSWYFPVYPTTDPCSVAPCSGITSTYPNMPLGSYTLTASSTSAGSAYALRSVELEPIAKRPGGSFFSFISDFLHTADASDICGFMNDNPSTCPNFVPTLTLATNGDVGNFIILWDPVAAISTSPSALSMSATSPNSTSTRVKLANSGGEGSTLNWTASSSAPWLSIWPTSGCLNAGGKAVNGCSDTNGYKELTLTANASGLASGTYKGTVTIAWKSLLGSSAFRTQTIPVTFTVGAAPPPPPPASNPPSCTFGANPQQIAPPEASTLSWTCQNAVSCQLDGASVPTSGSKQVLPTANTTYTLTCQGSGSGPTNTVTTQTTVTAGGPNVHEINP